VFICCRSSKEPVLCPCLSTHTFYSFIYSLFNDAFNSSDYIASNERMIVNNELERIWKEAVVT
jgi:hypothetical protein